MKIKVMTYNGTLAVELGNRLLAIGRCFTDCKFGALCWKKGRDARSDKFKVLFKLFKTGK